MTTARNIIRRRGIVKREILSATGFRRRSGQTRVDLRDGRAEAACRGPPLLGDRNFSANDVYGGFL
jgi:hypothetical protein